MTAEAYEAKLIHIMQEIQQGKISEVKEPLKELYHYKPVRLLWHVVNARLLFAENRCEEAWNAVAPYLWDGIDYPGIAEFRQFHSNLLRHRQAFVELKAAEYRYGNKKIRELAEQDLCKTYDLYCEQGTEEALASLMQEYLSVEQRIIFLILRMKLRQTGFISETDKTKWYYAEKNYDYLEEQLMHSEKAVLIIAEEKNQKECDLLAYLLHEMGHPVYLLEQPMFISDTSVHNESVVQVCIDNKKIYEDAIVIPVCETINTAGQRENNRAEILQYLYRCYFEGQCGIILATGDAFFELLEQPVIKKNLECLSEFDHISLSDRMYFGWIGDYQGYISDIYVMDVKDKISQSPVCDFSIVIPTRNSAGTLYYTLLSCLKQDYEGTYEIIVSDNSTGDYNEVYQVCQDLNDNRIKYVKTPRNLPLARSFEFAFLHARGEFVFSIGSDDGVCPWALKTIRKFLLEYPEDDVLQWRRGFYAWKGFEGPDEDKLVIPGQFTKGVYNCKRKSSIEYFAEVLKYSGNMYGLPTMYLNSGFRRSYFNTLLQKTGRLWDGCNQDLYMGIISAAINSSVLTIEFPLTIAGMSNNSLGYVMSKPSNESSVNEDERKIKVSASRGDNIGIYVLNGIVKNMPLGRGEVFSLYANLLRAIQLGVIPETWKEELFDNKKIYSEFFEEHTILDDEFDRLLHYARYQAKGHGEEFLNWFDETFYKTMLEPKYDNIKPRETGTKRKSYKEGVTPEQGLVLDASNYGVRNITEAMELFESFLYWTPESLK